MVYYVPRETPAMLGPKDRLGELGKHTMIESSIDFIVGLLAGISAGVPAVLFVLKLLQLRRSSPRLRIILQTDMSTSCSPNTTGRSSIFITIINRGLTPTTITCINFVKYRYWLYMVLNIRKECTTVSFPETIGSNVGTLPSKIGPNEQWEGIIFPDSMQEYMMDNSYLLLSINVTHSDRQVRSRRVTRYLHS